MSCAGEKRGLGESAGLFNSPPPLDTTRHLASQVDLSPRLPAGRAELPRVSLALLTAPQVGGHVLQHLDVLDGLSPGEVNHEHPVAR